MCRLTEPLSVPLVTISLFLSPLLSAELRQHVGSPWLVYLRGSWWQRSLHAAFLNIFQPSDSLRDSSDLKVQPYLAKCLMHILHSPVLFFSALYSCAHKPISWIDEMHRSSFIWLLPGVCFLLDFKSKISLISAKHVLICHSRHGHSLNCTSCSIWVVSLLFFREDKNLRVEISCGVLRGEPLY